MIVTVCGKYDLDLLPGSGGFYPYWQKMGQGNAACNEWLLEGLPKGLAVVENFGGVGICSTLVAEIIKPKFHLAIDREPDCVAQLRHIGVSALQADAMDSLGWVYIVEPGPLIINDFPSLTPLSLLGWYEPLAMMFHSQPSYVIHSDTGVIWLPLHRERFENILGYRIPRASRSEMAPCYSEAMSRLYYELFGYCITRAAHHTYASYFLLEPGWHEPIEHWYYRP